MRTLRNKVQLIGNLGNDPVVREFDNGNKMAKLSLATNEFRKNAEGEKIQTTQWHNLIAWGKKVDIIQQHLQKGNEIAIDGRIEYQTYDDKEGNKRYYTQVVINDFVMLK